MEERRNMPHVNKYRATLVAAVASICISTFLSLTNSSAKFAIYGPSRHYDILRTALQLNSSVVGNDTAVKEEDPDLGNGSAGYHKEDQNVSVPSLKNHDSTVEFPNSDENIRHPFNGTVITPLSHGADLFENVCMSRNGRKKGFFSYSSDGNSMKSGSIQYMKNPAYFSWVVVTQGRTLDQWATDSAEALITEETLLTVNIFRNPAHCLTDLTFSLALDVVSRGLNKPNDESQRLPFYPKYLYTVYGGPGIINKYDPDWCYEFMRVVGFIDPSRGLVYHPEFDKADNTVCFRKLIVPRLGLHRFPIDWSDPSAAWSVTKSRRTKGGDKSSGMYPIEGLQWLKDMVMKSTRLPSDSWNKKDLPLDVPILLYDRKGSKRRVMSNSLAVKDLIEAEYHATVHLWGEQWNDILHNFTAQATLYNSYPMIVAVHGAHLANLMFARPGTKVVEVVCGRVVPPANLTLVTKDQAKDSPLQWYGELGWFSSFSRRLSIEHFVFGEDSLRNNSPESFEVNTTRLVSFISSRFGLTRRRTED